VIRGNNLSEDGLFDGTDFVFVSEQKANRLVPNNAFPGDLIFTQRGTLGQVGLIPIESQFQRYVISQSQMKLTVNPERAHPAFVYYFFRHPATIQDIKNRVSSSGVPHINLGTLKELEIPLPPLEVQRKIVSVLSAYDDLIENNLRRIKLLEESGRLLYKEWFVRLRFPGHEHTRIVNGVPEGWEKKNLADVCDEVREAVSPRDVESDTPYIGLEHIPRRSITLSTWAEAQEVTSSKHRFCAGDILFGKIRPYFHKVGIAFVDGVASSDAIVIRPKADSVRSLVLLIVSSDRFVAEASQKVKEGSKMPRADWKIMREYAIALPPHALLDTLNSYICPITQQLKLLTMENRKLKQARDILLPKLMSGEVEV
jgi:type I restriction enzyme S subunit